MNTVRKDIGHNTNLSLMAKDACIVFPCRTARENARLLSFSLLERHKLPQSRLILERQFQNRGVVSLQDGRNGG